MNELRSVYVKCIRKKALVDPSDVRRYDSKYYYYNPKHPDSKFHKCRLKDKTLGRINLNYEFNDISFPTSAKNIADILEISTVEAIGLLIYKSFAFDIATEEWSYPLQQKETETPKSYIITTAQCNTDVHPFFQSLLYHCKLTNARLIVLPLYYGYSPKSEQVWFAEEVQPYLLTKKSVINDVQILGDLNNTATAVNPLSGLKPITAGKTIVVPSTHMMLERVPVPMGQRPLGMWATGACTHESYRKTTKAGYKAEFHHTLSAVRVDFDEDKNHYIRNVSGDSKTGVLYDLGKAYNSNQSYTVDYDTVLGDIHCGHTCPVTLKGYHQLLKDIGRLPKHTTLHDVFDGETINHHEAENPFAKFNHYFKSLDQELNHNVVFLRNMQKYCEQLVVVASNHNDFLNRWLKRIDWRKLDDVVTAQIYLNAASLASRGQIQDFYTYEMKERHVTNVLFLREGEDFSPKGVNYGHHGDKGSNGAKGGIKAFSHLGQKTVVGHSHTSGIYKSTTQVGTFSKLDLGYNRGGLSSWDNSLCIVHDGGKRQLIELFEGRYKP